MTRKMKKNYDDANNRFSPLANKKTNTNKKDQVEADGDVVMTQEDETEGYTTVNRKKTKAPEQKPTANMQDASMLLQVAMENKEKREKQNNAKPKEKKPKKEEFGFIESLHTRIMIAQYNQHMMTKRLELDEATVDEPQEQVLRFKLLALLNSPDHQEYPLTQNIRTVLEYMKEADETLVVKNDDGNQVELEELGTSIDNENLATYFTMANNRPNHASKFVEIYVAIPVVMTKSLQEIKNASGGLVMELIRASNIWIDEMQHNYLLTRRSGFLVEVAPFLVHMQHFEAELQAIVKEAVTPEIIEEVSKEEEWREDKYQATTNYICEMIELKRSKNTHQKGKPGQMTTNFLEIHVPKSFAQSLKDILCTVCMSNAWKKRFGKFAHTGLVNNNGVEAIQKLYQRQIQYNYDITRIPLYIPDNQYKLNGQTVKELVETQSFVQSVEPTYGEEEGKYFVILKHVHKNKFLYYVKNRLIPAVRASESRGIPYLDEIYNAKGQNKTAAERNAESFIVLDDEEPRLSPHLQRESFDIKQVTVPKKYGPAAPLPQWSTVASESGTKKYTPDTYGNGWSTVAPTNAWTKPLYDNRSQADTVEETNTLSDNQIASIQAEIQEMKEQQSEYMEKLDARHEKNMQSMMENMSKMMTEQIAQMMTGMVKIIDERALIIVKQHEKYKYDDITEDNEVRNVSQQSTQSTAQEPESASEKTSTPPKSDR